MGKIKIYYDPEGNTLNVWFDNPQKEHLCEETGDEVILIKDKRGKVIGFEKLNYISRKAKEKKEPIVLETLMG